MKTVGIYFHAADPEGMPFDKPDYRESYRRFSERCQSEDIRLVFVRGNEMYLGNMRCREAWEFDGTTLRSVPGPLTLDLLYLKSLQAPTQLSDTDTHFNHRELTHIATDKWTAYERFGFFMAPTVRYDAARWNDQKKELTTDRIVWKPLEGHAGQGIAILDRNDPPPAEAATAPYIVQEFVDASRGIPGLTQGVHDLRITVANGTPVSAMVRTPAPGSLLANVALGGQSAYFEPSRLPEETLAIVQHVDTEFAQYGTRFYSVDFMFDERGTPVLCELNAQPGLREPLYAGLIALFKEAAA